jgi:hypothetical protein
MMSAVQRMGRTKAHGEPNGWAGARGGRPAGLVARAASAVLLGSALAVACASGSGSNQAISQSESADLGDAAADGATISCANDPRAQAFVPNFTVGGAAGLFTFTITSATPSPPAVGDVNTWTLKITDAQGAPVTDAAFSMIKTWMPDHGHGSPLAVVAASNGDGTYAITSLDFFMTGLWQVTFFASSGTTSDSGMFSFCLGG